MGICQSAEDAKRDEAHQAQIARAKQKAREANGSKAQKKATKPHETAPKAMSQSDPAPDPAKMFDLHSWVLCGNLGKNAVVSDLKQQLLDCGYSCHTVNPYGKPGADSNSVTEVPEEIKIDVIHLCVNPVVSEKCMREAQARGCRNAFVQPGAGSDELRQVAAELSMAYREGCVLTDMELPAFS